MDTVRRYFTQIISLLENPVNVLEKQQMSIGHSEHELLDFSDEILLEIFSSFNDIDLLNAAQVCRRFRTIAKVIFAKRYNGDSDNKYYEIFTYTEDSEYDQSLYRKFLRIFGSEMSAINLTMERRTNKHNLLKLIRQQCHFVKHVIISNNRYECNVTYTIKSMPNLTTLTLKGLFSMNFYWADCYYPQLNRFYADDVMNIDVDVLKRFLFINPQIKHLHLISCRKFPLPVIQALRDRLKGLITLEYVSNKNEFLQNCRDINLMQLEELKITVDGSSFGKVIGAIARGSPKIKRLEVLMREHDMNIDAIHNQVENIIPQFKELTSLRLEDFDLGRRVIRMLTIHTPNVVCLKFDGVRLHEITTDDVLNIFIRCRYLKHFVLESSEHRIDADSFNLTFQRVFTKIVQSRGSDVNFEVIQPDTKLKITTEKVTKNDELLYWTGYDVSSNCSTNIHFLDLGDDCLKKIYSYLNEQSERALYETCTRTKKAMRERIKSQVFTMSELASVKDTINRFGDHLTKLAIDVQTNNDTEIATIWKHVGEVSEKITELSIINIKVKAIDSMKLNFPNLTTLKITSIVSGPTNILPPMECPKLSNLEFYDGEITFQSKPTHFGVSLNNLKRISLHHFSDAIGRILHSLHGRFCDQIEELTIDRVRGTTYEQKKLVNLATRFNNLITFNFIATDIEYTNTKYLFQTCTKLVNLSLGVDSYCDISIWRKTLQSIKANCKKLEVIRLVKYHTYFDQKLLMEINKLLPKTKLITIVYEPESEYYKVETYKKLTTSDRERPY